MIDLNLAFNELVKDLLWPAFKALGYKKSGNNFRYYNSEGWGKIVQFQKSQFNSAAALSFTVNTGLYLLDYDYCLCGQQSGEKFQEAACVVRKRIGKLAGQSDNDWFEITESSDKGALFNRLSTEFTQHIHPYLAAIKSKDAIYAILLSGHQADFPSIQIQTLFRAGYKEAALSLFASEFARSKSNKYYRATLQSLAIELGLPEATTL
jgi:hypothetical protein